MKNIYSLIPISLLTIVILLGFSAQAQITQLVTNTANAGVGSLRQAVIDAAPNDIIRLDPSLIAGGSSTIVLLSEIAFSKPLVFKGLYNNTDTLFINGNNAGRFFHITNTGNITIDSMVLVNGHTTYSGGAIHIVDSDSLFITNSTINNNFATVNGGAISSYSFSSSPSYVSVTNSTISNNSSGQDGGGISSYSSSGAHSSVTAINSTISNNSSGQDGGGIYSYCYSTVNLSTVTITNSTVSNNSANSGGGGGIFSHSYSSPSSVIVTNSTISNNSAITAEGGGIVTSSITAFAFSSVTVVNSTISNNSASYVGGIYTASVDAISSIIWTANGSGSNLYNGVVTSGGYNIFSDAPSGATATGDQINVTALALNLQFLANNGGTTETMLPGIGSVALSAGNPNDMSDAQNIPILGIREVGATENCNDYITDIQTACSSYTWIDGNTYTTSNNTATITFVNLAGCDSIVALDLTINNNSSIDAIVACDSLTWIDGQTYTSSNNSATFNIVGGNANGCDSLVMLDLTINNSSTGTDTRVECNSLTWIDGITYSSNNNTATFNITGGSSNGCDSLVTLDLTVSNLDANFTFADNGNGNYSLTNTSTGSFTQSHWAFGDGTIDSIANPNHTFSTNGFFTVILTILDSTVQGDSCISYYLDTINVTGVPNPLQCNSGFAIYPDTTSSDINIINSSTGNNLTYSWSFGDGNTSTLQNPSHTYTTAGPFYLCLTIDDGNGCTDMYCDSIGKNGVIFNKSGGFNINVTSPNTTGIDNINLNSEINLYPNPTSHQLTIDTEQSISEINIIDITGKTVMVTKENTKVLNVVDLSNGIYFIKVIVDERTITKKFVKQ